MKRIAVLLLAVLVLVPMVAFAAPLDLAGATKEELLEWRQQIDDALLLNGWFPFTVIDSKTSGEQVLRLQERLSKLYYYTKEPTGRYDSNTSKAFAAFMKAQGLKAGKTVTIENQELLFSSNAIPKTTPLPPPTPTPPPAPFFSQAQDDLSGPFARFCETHLQRSEYNLMKISGAANEFYSLDQWRVDLHGIYTNDVYVYRENASGKIVAIAIYCDFLDDGLGITSGSVGIFKETISLVMKEFNCEASVTIDGYARRYEPYILLSLEPAKYGGNDTSVKLYQSSEIQFFESIAILFLHTRSIKSQNLPGAAFIIGFDNFIHDLPFIEMNPLATPAPTPPNPPTVSRQEYQQVYVGMSYANTIRLFGGPGTKDWSSTSSLGTLTQYTWKSEWGNPIVITFRDGKISTISEY